MEALYASSRLINSLLGGSRNETLCSRMGRDVAAGRCKFCGLICRLLDGIDKDHCAKAAEAHRKEQQC